MDLSMCDRKTCNSNHPHPIIWLLCVRQVFLDHLFGCDMFHDKAAGWVRTRHNACLPEHLSRQAVTYIRHRQETTPVPRVLCLRLMINHRLHLSNDKIHQPIKGVECQYASTKVNNPPTTHRFKTRILNHPQRVSPVGVILQSVRFIPELIPKCKCQTGPTSHS